MDYEIQRCTRCCATTERELAPGEMFYSALISEGADLLRLDYSVEAWKGPPDGTIGWWKSEMPSKSAKKMQWAPNDVMLQFFEELEETDQPDIRYVLALLMVRRRVLRLEEEKRDDEGREVLVVYCPRREATYEVAAVTPSQERIEAIQEELAKLLFAKAG